MADSDSSEVARTPIAHPRWLRTSWRVALFALIIGAGLAGERHMRQNRKPPERVSITTPSPQVSVITAQQSDERIVLQGFGTVRAGTTVEVRPQVGGRVTAVHPRLEQGETIAKGEVLLQIETRDFELKIAATRQAALRLNAEIAGVREELMATEALLVTRRASAALSQSEAERQRQLYQDEGVGTRSAAEQAERLALLDSEQLTALANTTKTLPHRIAALEAQLAANATQLAVDELQLGRATITAPFAGRAVAVRVEMGDVVSPGTSLVSFVDDSDREIVVNLDAREVHRWLRFEGEPKQPGWFASPEAVAAEILWLGDSEGPRWAGTVLRIEDVDPRDRLVAVALSVNLERPAGMPLVAGMFCEVRIPGKLESAVFRVPRVVLREDGGAFTANDEVLATRNLEVIREDGEELLVRGLEVGDAVVTNRLKGAVRGMRVNVRERDGETLVSTDPGAENEDSELFGERAGDSAAELQ
jgi:membrane fusion protein, multidrug efflux system